MFLPIASDRTLNYSQLNVTELNVTDNAWLDLPTVLVAQFNEPAGPIVAAVQSSNKNPRSGTGL